MSSERLRHPDNVVSRASATDDGSQTLSRQERQLQHALNQIAEALRGLRFGQVTVTVQDGVVVQIDRLERTRLQRSAD
jgi:hypothetical protein